MGRATSRPSPVGRTATQILSGTIKTDQDRTFSLRQPAGDALTSKLAGEREHMGRRLAFFIMGISPGLYIRAMHTAIFTENQSKY
jgi:hypothetical protein